MCLRNLSASTILDAIYRCYEGESSGASLRDGPAVLFLGSLIEETKTATFESFFGRKLSKSEVEEKLKEVEAIGSKRSKKTSSYTRICVMVKETTRKDNLYFRVRVNRSFVGSEDRVNVYPGSFVIDDCDQHLDNNGNGDILITIFDAYDEILFEKYTTHISNSTLSKKEVFCEFLGDGEGVKFEVYNSSVDLTSSGTYEDRDFIGHRGCGMDIYETSVKENTIASFIKAYGMGIRWIELDVQLTLSAPVVQHDFYVRLDNKDHTYLCNISHTEFLSIVGNPNEDNLDLPCTLENVISSIDEELGINIEIKFPFPDHQIHGYPGNPEEFVNKIVSIVRKSGKKKIIFSSFHPHILISLKLALPNFSTYMLTEANGNGRYPYVNTLYEALYFSLKLGLDGIAVDWSNMSEHPVEVIRIFRTFELEVMIYGDQANVEENITKLRNAGVSIIGDRLDLMLTE